ncbi:DUF4178 domain-containing protein [Hymenobacter sp. BT178]|uniref:DUF4178 domain-containing protein n=2 Tax=Hymenobacter lucidus TaxID=2880930 RepID=A0ABS8APT0_9BACT|nr:DUF4178 domain-containing protein [Hymenobacter lucidus]
MEARLACPACQEQLTYYDVVNSTHFACPACHVLFSQPAQGPALKVRQFQDVPRLPPCLPLGSLGTMPDGLPYRVTGYMLRKEKSSPARWQEFMLFNPTAGYAQLALYEGHWTFIKPAAELRSKQQEPQSKTRTQRYVLDNDIAYALYNKYQPRILYARGEFDWNILDDERLNVFEYVAPPHMLVQETGMGQQPQWYRAEHIEPAAVARAFGVAISQLPDRDTVGAIQPAPGGDSWPAVRRFTLLLLGLLVLTEIVLASLRPSRQLLSQHFVSGASQALPSFRPDSTEKVLVSSPFEITEPSTVLDINLRAEIDNSWLELPVSLVNEQTGQGFEFTKNMEYYHGVESGESWSEGSVQADATLTKIPAGRYHLNLYPVSENNRPVGFSLTVTENSWQPGNFFLFGLALLVYPGLLYWRRYNHEQARWAQSNYGPLT